MSSLRSQTPRKQLQEYDKKVLHEFSNSFLEYSGESVLPESANPITEKTIEKRQVSHFSKNPSMKEY